MHAGREGHAHFINGAYDYKRDTQHDLRPVFRHRVAIPKGFKAASGVHARSAAPLNAAGKYLHLYYHADNDAWAISTELGSLVCGRLSQCM